MSEGKQQFHWFTSSIFHWRVHEDLAKCIDAQRKADKAAIRSMNGGKTPKTKPLFQVYRVPLPVDAHYRIENFRPVVAGTEYVATCNSAADPADRE